MRRPAQALLSTPVTDPETPERRPATTEKLPTLARELAALERMTATELRDKYAVVFGDSTASGNRAWLARRVG